MTKELSEHDDARNVSVDGQDETEYVPPQIESVLTAEDLTREIQYAGLGS